MTRSLMILGVLLCVLGIGLLAVTWLLPAGGDRAMVGNWYDSYLVPAGVITAGLALAGGLALIGIGYGRWRHPLRARPPSSHEPIER